MKRITLPTLVDKRILLPILLCSFFFQSFAQDAPSMDSKDVSFTPAQLNGKADSSGREATSRKNTISATIGFFDPWIGVAYEHTFFSRWGIDVSAGILGGSVGTKYYFPKLSEGKISVYVGFSEGILLGAEAKHYIPVGVTFLGKEGFRINLDVGPQIPHGTNGDAFVGLSLRLGKSF